MRWLRALLLNGAKHLGGRIRILPQASRRQPAGPVQPPPRALGEPPDIRRSVIPDTSSIREAMKAIDRDVSRIALLVNDAGVLVGTVTDGDARRAILAGINLDSPARPIMAAQPIVAHPETTDDEIVNLMLLHSVRQVPVTDYDGRVVDIKLLDRITQPGEARIPVLIMAGGLGSRLGELTREVPKPLVQVGGRPILATLIQDLAAQGFLSIILAVGHRADLIENYFGDGMRFGVNITYVREREPLGTAGAIALALPQLAGEFIVTNADLLTRANFDELTAFHRAERDDLTIGVIESTYQLRYGLVETDGSRVTGIREKPELRHFVNGGIYVLEREIGRLVPPNVRFDMDHLIRAALAGGYRVGCFPIHEFWADIGEPEDLRRASAAYERDAASAARRR